MPRKAKISYALNISSPTGPDKFLENFGYLTKSTMSGSYHSPEARTEAIKDFQRMAHVPVTGVMDEPTRTKMMAPRCGVPDRFPNRRSADDNGMGPQNFEMSGLIWKKKKLTWKFQNWSPNLDAGTQRYALWRAFKYWSDVSGMEFYETRGEADVNIRYAYGDHGDGSSFDGPGNVLAHAYMPESGMLHFDDDEMWTMGRDEGTNLMIVAAHEIGHILGLYHSTNDDALMAPWYAGYTPENMFNLHQDDVRGVQHLYGPKIKAVVTTTTTTQAPTTTTTTQAPTTTTTTQAPTTSQAGPDPCTMKFDAVFSGFRCTYSFRSGVCRHLARDNTAYVISGQYVFRLDGRNIMFGYPIKIRELFPRAPYTVDAAVYSPRTNRVYLFKSRRIWRYTAGVTRDGKASFRLDRGFPINKYRERQFPEPQAALTEAGRVLLLTNNMVYEYSEYYVKVNVNVRPQYISRKFPGIPTYPDAALNDGRYMYFFKGDRYRKFVPTYGIVADYKYNAEWMGCNNGRSSTS